MKTVTIVENDYENLRNVFDYVNEKYFDGKLHYIPITSVNDGTDLKKISDSDLVLVDIQLGDGSSFDGYEAIRRLQQFPGAADKTVIITGHSLIEDNLRERGLPAVEFLVKPLRIKVLKKLFHERLGLAIV